MGPKNIVADTSVEALEQIILPPFLSLETEQPKLIVSDEEMPCGWAETRWDEPLDRGAWHFGHRRIQVYLPEQDT